MTRPSHTGWVLAAIFGIGAGCLQYASSGNIFHAIGAGLTASALFLSNAPSRATDEPEEGK